MKGFKNTFRLFKICIKIKPAFIAHIVKAILFNLFYTLLPIGLVEVVVYLYEHSFNYYYVLIACGVIAAIFYSMNAISFYMNKLYSRHFRDYQARFENIIFNKLDEVDYEVYQSTKFLNDYTRAIDEGPYITRSAMYAIEELLSAIISVIIVFAVFATLNGIIIIYAFFASVIFILLGKYSSKISWNLSEKQKQNYRHRGYFRRMFYLKDAAEDIRTSNIKTILIDNNEVVCERVVKNTDKYLSLRAILTFISMVLIRSIYPVGLAIIGYFYLAETSLLSVATLVTAAGTLSYNVWGLAESITYFEYQGVQGEAVFRVLNQSGEIEISGSEEINDFKTLDINNVSFSYGEKQALTDVKLSIKKGDKIAIVGENGAGKTTLVKLLLRLYDVSDGNIEYNRTDYRSIRPKAIRQRIGAAFQEFELYAFTIAENVLMRKVENEDDETLVINALKFVGLYDKVKNFEKGIYTPVTKEFDKEGVELSGGEKQKLALARVFAADYDLIILDEPNSKLDPLAEADLYEKMMKLGDDHTLIFISHRLSTTIKADKIYLFANGRIIEEGTHKQLMNIPDGKYKYMFDIQSQNYVNGVTK